MYVRKVLFVSLLNDLFSVDCSKHPCIISEKIVQTLHIKYLPAI